MITGIHHISMKCGSEVELNKTKDFYINLLGLKMLRTWPDGIMIDAGNTLLEIFTNGEGIKELGAIRHIAFATDNVDEIIEKVRSAGYEVFKEPTDVVIASTPELPAKVAFCYGPLGEEVEFFHEK
ncbi:glyoxylase I family protein [Pseudobutyrivibrio sp. 49]|uniref:VOC family protein n=1 Tax=unclassified Pseudobutyrivibrio TaxID=2638619 RepID=UPI00088EA15E|nr:MULTISPECIES: VOC family protein [unclassified Pseudobutyrivibrio]SDI74734.1 glyoxylase I family protein [Pseudobutyrivibrio sp. 49]SFN96893.1 glyoxylase I family protein [Pseudobutyrivibrio sp. UC1225]